MRKLNNFVTEILDLTSVHAGRYVFGLEHDEWLLIRSTPKVEPGAAIIRLDCDTLYAHEHGEDAPKETMRKVKAGTHEICVSASRVLDTLQVRRIPEIQHIAYYRQPNVGGYQDYNWAWLKDHVLPHVNTIVCLDWSVKDRQHLDWWKSQGGKLLATNNVDKYPIDNLVAAYQTDTAYTNDLYDGHLADEFGSTYAHYDEYIAAVRQLNLLLPTTSFNAYFNGDALLKEKARLLAQACIAGGGKAHYECYMPTRSTYQEAEQAMTARYMRVMDQWDEDARYLVWTLAAACFPDPHYHKHPSVNFHAWLDIQMQHVATMSQFDGLGGIAFWATTFMDADTVQYCAKLHRHYCIEGNTVRMTNMPYDGKDGE